MAIAPGMRIGKYELRRLLGQGGFGMVYVAHDIGLDRELAIKFLLPEHIGTPELLQRFFQEARSAAKIAHLGIVTVFECGVVEGTNTPDDGTAFIAMELLVGESLSDRLARVRQLPPDVAIEIARQVASALGAAHRAGIVHRDLKPDNIYLVPDPAAALGERVKVLDFGIAKLADAKAGNSVQTRSVMVFGTPRYMSPEQCRSAASVDPRSDIYALGCILFELLCGQPPFDGEPGELIAKHQLAPAPTARSIRPDLSPVLDHAVTVMMAKQPEHRPQTMDDVMHLLETCGGMAHGVAPSGGYAPVHAGMVPTAGSMTPHPGTYQPSSQPPGTWQPPSQPPSQPSSQPSSQSPGQWQQPSSQPPGTWQQTGPQAQGTQPPAYGRPPTEIPPPRKMWPFLVFGVLAVAAIVIAIVATRSETQPVVAAKLDAGSVVAVGGDAAVARDAAVVAVTIDAGVVATADAQLAVVADAQVADAGAVDEAATKLRTRCLELVAMRSWKELAECATQLAAAKDPDAPSFADQAKREVGNSKIFADLQTAVRAGNLTAAKHSFEELGPESVYRGDAQVLLDGAGKKAVTADERAAIALAKEGKCKELDALKAQAAKRSKEEGDSIRAVACTQHVDPPPKPCDPFELIEQGNGQLKTQQNTAALAFFEQAIECNLKNHQPIEPATMRLAFTAACKMKNATKAKQYWTQLGKIPQHNLKRLCIDNGIDPE
jgi:eukaryotic-like serine/threonine-protein kinase